MLLDGHLDRQSRLICSGLRVEMARRTADHAGLLEAMEANLAISDSMPVSNFGSFEGYAATPLAALELLASSKVAPTMRERAMAPAKRGLRTLGRYALVFPIGRPRLALCRGLEALAAGRRRRAEAWVRDGLALAQRLGMADESARLTAALDHLGRPRCGDAR
jgi:hypothetical protein